MTAATALVIGSTSLRSSIVGELEWNTELADALRAAGARIVVFEMERYGGDPVFVRAQRALDAAEAEYGLAVARPIYLAIGSLSELYETGELRRPGPPLVTVRGHGVFAGFLAIGEGGLAFVCADRTIGGVRPTMDQVRTWLRALAPD
jgi:hypothetical protein